MESSTRRAIAYIAVRAAGGRGASAIHDSDEGKYFSFSGDVSTDRAMVYDHDRSCYVGGPIANLYDYGLSAFVSLTLSGSQFNGYDYRTRAYFSGTVNGNTVSVYDYTDSSHHQYSI